MAVTLVTGPVRSGKSRFVVALAQRSGRRVTFIATATRDPLDNEWEERMDRHLRDRPREWNAIETASLDHASLLQIFAHATHEECLIVDALGTWLASRLSSDVAFFERDPAGFSRNIEREGDEFVEAMCACRAQVVLVAEEVGWDVVPTVPSARMFRDVIGRLKQRVAARAQHAFLVVCGYALDVRSLGIPVE